MAAEAASLERLHVEALTRLAGGVAHDVKNPLNAMALQLALLGDKVATEGEWLDLSAYAPDAASLFSNEARRRGVELRCEAPSMPLRACCAPASGARLVLVLFLEAVLNAPRGGKIVVTAAGAGGEVRLTVARSAGGETPGVLEAVRAAAESMGGALEVAEGGATATRVLRLRGERTQ